MINQSANPTIYTKIGIYALPTIGLAWLAGHHHRLVEIVATAAEAAYARSVAYFAVGGQANG